MRILAICFSLILYACLAHTDYLHAQNEDSQLHAAQKYDETERYDSTDLGNDLQQEEIGDYEDADYIDSFIKIDTAFLKPAIKFEQLLNEKYNSEEYLYDQETTGNYWKNFRDWLVDKIQKFFNLSEKQSASQIVSILETIIYILIFSALVIFIIKVIRNKEGRWSFKKDEKKIDSDIKNLEEMMSTINFEKIITESISHAEYRLAIRYYFVWILKLFDERNIIRYTSDKTSEDYIREISNDQLKNDYIYAVYLYNYIWYGGFDIDETMFRQIESNFKKIIYNNNEL